jgi:threonine dehydratase
MISDDWIQQARRRLTGLIQQTPLTYDPDLDVYLKWENRQITGSFKIRGALNKVLALERWEQERGIVTASAGNHGQGTAYAARQVGVPVVVFASEHAVPAKVARMRALGADVRLVPGGYEAAEKAGQQYAASTGATWVSPYNDGQVIAGQATVGLEILEQLAPDIPGVVVVPVGGGGLIAGVGAALQGAAIDEGQPRPQLVGVQSEASPFFYAIYHRGTQAGVVEFPSVADGLAGAVEDGSITIPMVRRMVNRFVLVTEEQITRAVCYAWERHDETIEGSAAAALAAVMNGAVDDLRMDGRPMVAVMSGGNVQPEAHRQMCIHWED